MRLFSSTLTAAIAVSLIAGCSGNAAAPGVSEPLPQLSSPSQLAPSQATKKHTGSRVKSATTSDLYVADEAGNQVSVYSHTGTPICTIKNGISAPVDITFDASGNLYVANLANNTVTVYATTCATAPSRTITKNVAAPTAVAVGPAGFIYVANSGANSVTVYDGSGFMESLPATFIDPRALAFDSKGTLYVANGPSSGCDGGCYVPGWITVCTGSVPYRTCPRSADITSQMDDPQALAVDKSDNLYVANDVEAGDVPKFSSYATGNKYTGVSFGAGLKQLVDPNALTFDALGHLCVSSSGNSSVFCYKTWDVLFRALSPADGIDNPTSLAVGPSGWLNVGNNFVKGSVTQYCPEATGCPPPTKINQSIDGPVSIGFGP